MRRTDMKIRKIIKISLLLIWVMWFSFSCEPVGGEDWLQWRGPDRSDRSSETGLLQSWPADGPTKSWTFDRAGAGYSGFSIADGYLYTLGDDGRGVFAICLDASSGQEVWRSRVGQHFENDWGDGPRSTPTISGDLIFAIAPAGELVCLERSSGGVIWKKRLQDFGGKIPKWGYSESPLVIDEQVFCTPGGDEGAIVALNSNTGELIWQTEQITSPAHYASMIRVDYNGSQQLIHLLVDQVVGIDRSNGKLLWQVDWPGRTAIIPTAIFDDGIVYVSSGYGIGCSAFRIGPDNQIKELYRNKVMKNHHGGVIQLGDHVYGYSDKVGFVCQDISAGGKIWADKTRIKKGALTFADGQFYFVQERDGVVLLLDATPSGLNISGRFTLSPQSAARKPRGRIWTHPVVAAGKLFLRDQEYIYAFNIRR